MDSSDRSPANQGPRQRGRTVIIGLFVLGPAALGVLVGVGGDWWLLDLISHFQAYLLVPQFVGLLLALVWRSRRWGLIALVLGILGVAPWLHYWRPGPPVRSLANDLDLVCFNVNANNPDPESIASTLLEHPPDAIALIEVTPRIERALAPLNATYPFRYTTARDDYFGMAIWSRLPETTIQERRHGAFQLPSLEVRFLYQGRTVRWVVVHPPPPVRLRLFREQSQTLNELSHQLSSADAIPTLASGDWNLTPFAGRFRSFSRETQLRDASIGFGLQPTWRAGPLPFIQIPIDHFLVSRHWTVVEETVEKPLGSDHRLMRLRARVSREDGD